MAAAMKKQRQRKQHRQRRIKQQYAAACNKAS